MKAAQNQLFLARVGVDIAHGKDTLDAGGKFFSVYGDLFAFHVQTPVCNRAQFGRQTKEHQQRVKPHRLRLAVHIGDHRCCELVAVLVVFSFKACDLPDHEAQGFGIHQRLDIGKQCRCGLEHVPPMDQRDASGLVWPFCGKVASPGEGGVLATHNHEVFVGQPGRITNAVKQAGVVKLFNAFNA